jgi:hypothetical protein
MIKKLLFVLTIMVFTSLYSYAQESCTCSSTAGGCSASQTCPAGKSAVCTCSLTGCSSFCQREEPILDRVSITKLGTATTGEIGGILSSISGMNVRFKPTIKGFRLSEAKRSKTSHWDLLEELSRNGELTINGQKLGFWKGMQKTLLEGGEFKICTGGASVQRILSMVSFISGKNYSISSGDANARITGQIEGNNLTEILEDLQKVGGITVAKTY